MKRILLIHSSLFVEDSVSSRIASTLVDRLVDQHPGSEVTTIDLSGDPLPHLDAAEFSSWMIPGVERDEAQAALARRSEALIEQLLAHDVLVMAVPMYNFGIPSTLKAWIDRVSRAGKTFRYTSNGPEGLVENMQAFLVLSRGGIYRDTPMDTLTPYLKSALGLMGIQDIETIFAEGLNMGDDNREAAISDALSHVEKLSSPHFSEVHHAA